MADVSEEERKYSLYRGRCPWLRLAIKDEGAFLGCSVCAAIVPKPKSKFATFSYKIGKYFHDRTLKEHEGQCQAHVSAVRAQQAADAEPAPATHQAAGAEAAAHAGSSLSRGDSSSSCKEGHEVDETKSTKSKKLTQQFRNELLGAHMAMRSLQSSSVFALLLQFGKMAAAVLPNGADSSTIFGEVCGILSSMCLQDVV